MILIITNKEDITADFIVKKLNISEEKYYRFNTETLVTDTGVNLDFTSNNYFLVDYKKNQIIDLSQIKSVYYRRPKTPQFSYTTISKGENEFISREIIYLLEGIYRILSNKYWISPIDAIRKAESKIYQLIQAKKFGFEIPSSLITTLQNEAKDFFNTHNKDCIIKPIKNGLIKNRDEQKIIFTSLISVEHEEILKDVNLCPTYFQNRIDKVADLRVTVVGNKVFAAKISSQEHKECSIDWRKGENIYLKHERINLPFKLERRCIQFVKSLGLVFGAMDFAVDKNDNYIFLEINPNGQWAWIENRLGYDISGEIVKLLRGAGNGSIV